ncbi:hypothetical protein EJB05_09096 [Eragrostis curvula]|uniref:MATH domain-containing protein n=1 Tax=Eragrostis curvula TaxID=38414 RepID=A0A5J9W417_9POAL|nr:hypothetical protein EJB05_09096 [Eragrostis curvula]
MGLTAWAFDPLLQIQGISIRTSRSISSPPPLLLLPSIRSSRDAGHLHGGWHGVAHQDGVDVPPSGNGVGHTRLRCLRLQQAPRPGRPILHLIRHLHRRRTRMVPPPLPGMGRQLRLRLRVPPSPPHACQGERLLRPQAVNMRVLDPKDTMAYHCMMMQRSELEATYVKNDRLTMECVVTVRKEPRVSKTKVFPRIKVPPSDIKRQLTNLLDDRYDVARLKLICQSILCKNLDVKNVATTLALADQHHCDRLKDACIEFMSCLSTMDDLVATQGYQDLAKTSSSILDDAMTRIENSPPTPSGEHVFEVTDYSLHRCLDAGLSSIRSSTFNVGGYAWSISFHPSGDAQVEDSGDYVAVNLELMTKGALVKVSYDMALVDMTTGVRWFGAKSEKAELDTRCANSFCRWCLSRFIRRDKLEASPYLHDDRVVIECTLTVIKGSEKGRG